MCGGAVGEEEQGARDERGRVGANGGGRARWKECGEGKGWRKKEERAATPHVCCSTCRHGDPSAFVTVMGWENTEPGGARVPRLSRTPALTIILLKEGKTALSGSSEISQTQRERSPVSIAYFRCPVCRILDGDSVL